LADNLNDITVKQNETLIELRNVLADFVAENDHLESLNDGLVSVVDVFVAPIRLHENLGYHFKI
jgi:hypothetical protein